MSKELSSFGDHAEVTMQTKAVGDESVGIAGHYHVVCHDADGNLKWEESFPNLVNAVGKQLMFDTLLSGSSYTTVGPFLGLISGASPTFAAADTMVSHAGWTEFVNYTVGGSAVRGAPSFASAATSSGTTPSNVTTKAGASVTYTITGAGGTVGGCFLVTGAGAVNTQSNTSGTLYSAGAFATAKVTTVGDTVSVTYSTTATS
ncbi:hypothetical protein UFOVP652_74 [uncultured Caudovirales phage]|uniref:Uncharacterized protein n=1 Tax=uncultured Caudovirales phage TaxID=2100421 RepID=A0A6J5NDL5_9CAUD|nr:hypothetical protein UFOVP652_74 [uncultured Caudovirales phage]CAB5224311.1 hypothetical protein UFOVP734_50 [uncultured Caudovirales phage]